MNYKEIMNMLFFALLGMFFGAAPEERIELVVYLAIAAICFVPAWFAYSDGQKPFARGMITVGVMWMISATFTQSIVLWLLIFALLLIILLVASIKCDVEENRQQIAAENQRKKSGNAGGGMGLSGSSAKEAFVSTTFFVLLNFLAPLLGISWLIAMRISSRIDRIFARDLRRAKLFLKIVLVLFAAVGIFVYAAVYQLILGNRAMFTVFWLAGGIVMVFLTLTYIRKWILEYLESVEEHQVLGGI